MSMDVFFEYKRWHFEWDSKKETKNIEDHNVNFRDAAITFRDGESVIHPDHKHSKSEERWVNFGLDNQGQLLEVCVTWRETEIGEPSYRIISAHKISAKNVSRSRKRIARRTNKDCDNNKFRMPSIKSILLLVAQY